MLASIITTLGFVGIEFFIDSVQIKNNGSAKKASESQRQEQHGNNPLIANHACQHASHCHARHDQAAVLENAKV